MASLQLLLWGSIVLSLGYLAVAAALSIVAALRAGGRREESPDGHDAVAASRLTVPVSIIVPAGSGSPHLAHTIELLLALAYPEFEVIVIVETPSAGLETLSEAWQLESREFFYRQTLETSPVRRILRSQRDPRLMVVEKASAPRHDALNCGVNLARYRFVAVVPPDLVFDDAALLRAMAPALRDPASVIGVSSHIERVPDELGASDWESRFQRLQSLRAQMVTRLFWADRQRALGPDDAVFIWRRDALLQASGFSRLAANPDVDMMFRLQCGVSRDERRFIRNPNPFGRGRTLDRVEARERAIERQRTAVQMSMTWGASASRSLGGSFALFMRSELLTPLAQGWVVAGTLAGTLAGWYQWTTPVLAILLLAFGGGAVSAAALLLRGAYAGAPAGEELRALLLLSPLELVVRGPRQAWARLSALGPAAKTAARPTRG